MRHLLAVTLLALSALLAWTHGPVIGAAAFLVGSAAIVTPSMLPSLGALCDATLTPTILLTNTLRKLFVKVPALSFFSSEFTTERVKLNQPVIGKIRVRPVASEFAPNAGGYEAGAQEGATLLRDVNFVMDKHIHVTISMSHLNALQNSIQKMEEHMEDSASVIGATIARYFLSKIRFAAFPHATALSVANSDKDALNAVRKAMNLRGVHSSRFGLVNSDVAEVLTSDTRIADRFDNRSADVDSNPYLTLRGISGFSEIREDPGLESGNTTAVAVTGEADDEVFTTAAAHGFVVGDRVYLTVTTGGAGLTTGYYFVKTRPLATTFTLSSTVGGATAAFTTDLTTATVRRGEEITGFFATREAIAIKTALPADSLEIARSLGIPTPVSDEIITDPDSGLSMIAYMWFKTGTMEAYVTLACLFGAVAGADCDTEAHVMAPSGQILRTA
jgi:hypothetical protein